jgi:hypothetical protein
MTLAGGFYIDRTAIRGGVGPIRLEPNGRDVPEIGRIP